MTEKGEKKTDHEVKETKREEGREEGVAERKRDDDAFRRGDEAGRGEKEKGREAEVKVKA